MVYLHGGGAAAIDVFSKLVTWLKQYYPAE
jgi:hypothetical protein